MAKREYRSLKMETTVCTIKNPKFQCMAMSASSSIITILEYTNSKIINIIKHRIIFRNPQIWLARSFYLHTIVINIRQSEIGRVVLTKNSMVGETLEVSKQNQLQIEKSYHPNYLLVWNLTKVIRSNPILFPKIKQ